jgi:hypothetical protein
MDEPQPSVFQLVSALLVIFLPAAVIAYDLVAYWVAGREATLTAAVDRLATLYPDLPAIAGGLFCYLWLHLFLSGILLRLRG